MLSKDKRMHTGREKKLSHICIKEHKLFSSFIRQNILIAPLELLSSCLISRIHSHLFLLWSSSLQKTIQVSLWYNSPRFSNWPFQCISNFSHVSTTAAKLSLCLGFRFHCSICCFCFCSCVCMCYTISFSICHAPAPPFIVQEPLIILQPCLAQNSPPWWESIQYVTVQKTNKQKHWIKTE